MKFPHGIADFYKIITEGYFYVDRTSRIPLIEDSAPNVLFLRPPRFGKSLLLSMLSNYYDVAKSDQFERLFGRMAIGQNPTARHNHYCVMTWDFSALDTQGDGRAIRNALHDHVNQRIAACACSYQDLLQYPVTINPNNALSSWQSLLMAIKLSGYKLYLFIDNYDILAKEALASSNQERAEALRYGVAALRTIFAAVKSGTSGDGLAKSFVTGVLPAIVSDIGSAYNIAWSIYLSPQFNDLCGFVETEIEAALYQIAQSCDLPAKSVTSRTMMRCGGYSFSRKKGVSIYHPTNALFFLEKFQREEHPPSQLSDNQSAREWANVTSNVQYRYEKQLMKKAVKEELTVDRLSYRCGVNDTFAVPKRTELASLLYYFGFLTLGGRHKLFGNLILKIPNPMVRQLYL